MNGHMYHFLLHIGTLNNKIGKQSFICEVTCRQFLRVRVINTLLKITWAALFNMAFLTLLKPCKFIDYFIFKYLICQ